MYLWLKNPGHLSSRQQERLEQFRSQYLETAKAYQLKLAFQDLYLQIADHAVAISATGATGPVTVASSRSANWPEPFMHIAGGSSTGSARR